MFVVEYIAEPRNQPFGKCLARKVNKRVCKMALTKDFKHKVVARVQKDARFRRALLSDSVEVFLAGDVATGKTMLRDYINATLGFEKLAMLLQKPSKSIHRMLGPSGNPTAENIFAIIKLLQDEAKITFQVKAEKRQAVILRGDRLVIGGTVRLSYAALLKLVQQNHIRRLVMFGSAARGEIKPDSDIDLIVYFDDGMAPSLGGMVELQDAFIGLFGGRKVDLATPSILNNPYRRSSIEKDMEVLYAA